MDPSLWESNTDVGGNGELNGTPEQQAIYQAIAKVDDRVREVERNGCGLRDIHDRDVGTLHVRIDKEKEAREKMGEKLESRMDTIRNQILIGIAVALFLAVLAGKFL